MTDPLDQVSASALSLPETTADRDGDRKTSFAVAGRVFAVLDGTDLHLLVDGEDRTFDAIPLAGEPDWALVEDRIARSWELAAPAQLLEAGGR